MFFVWEETVPSARKITPGRQAIWHGTWKRAHTAWITIQREEAKSAYVKREREREKKRSLQQHTVLNAINWHTIKHLRVGQLIQKELGNIILSALQRSIINMNSSSWLGWSGWVKIGVRGKKWLHYEHLQLLSFLEVLKLYDTISWDVSSMELSLR